VDKLVFHTETGESILPPECAVIVLTSTLANSASFVTHHFLQALLKATPENDEEGVIYASFLGGVDSLSMSMKKLVRFKLQ
jgi:hypothetical protein